jgi:hypothetical protein
MSPLAPERSANRPLVPRSVTTARTGCHGGLSEFVPVDEVDAATVLSHTQREIPPDQVLATWCRSHRRLGAPHDLHSLQTALTDREQQLLELRRQLEERTEELAAARATNRELMTQLNTRH